MNINKTVRKISRNQKPIEYDIYLKYICKKCGQVHWLSINEASTIKYKIVCFCGHVFGVKRVKDFQLIYHKKNKQIQKVIENTKSETKPLPVIPITLLDQTMNILIGYGFTKTEAKTIITKSYESSPVDNAAGLVKQILESLRSANVK